MRKIERKILKRISPKHFIYKLFCIITSCLLVTTVVFAVSSHEENQPHLDIYATNISFNDSIYIKYAVNCENVDDQRKVELLVWDQPADEYIKNTESASLSSLGSQNVEGVNCLIFDYKDIAAKELSDYVYARAYYKSGDNEYYSDVKKYSVLTYAYNKLGYTSSPTENEDLIEVLHGLLEYGASAQSYFDYKADSLVTAPHVKITLKNGTFEDGFNTTLAKIGSTVVVCAPDSVEGSPFGYWADQNGNLISVSGTFSYTVGDVNSTLIAHPTSFQGGEIEGSGANIDPLSFAMTEHFVDTSDLFNVTSDKLSSIISDGLDENSIYRISDGNPLYITDSIIGKNSVLIAPAGVIIDGVSNISLNDLIIIGDVSVTSSSSLSFSSVEIRGNENAVCIDDNSRDITFDNCRILSDAVGISNSAINTTVSNSFLSAKSGVINVADELTVYNCSIFAETVALRSSGNDVAINNCSVNASGSSDGIVVDEDSLNTLLSYNVITGCDSAISVSSSTNTVVLFNSCYNIAANNNTNLYIVENSLGGKLSLSLNNYLLCDSNSYYGKTDHSPSLLDNQNVNGDSITDVDERSEVGANEEILPHTNKDLFLDMDRKEKVKDVAGGTNYSLGSYIEAYAKTNDVVIVPPGAYKTSAGVPTTIDSSMSNTRIYAFGVLNEHGFNTDEEYLAGAGGNYIMRLQNADNVEIHGITLGYDYQASGQVHVLSKLEASDTDGKVTNDNCILVVPAAGYDIDAGFGKSNTGVFSNSYTSKFCAGELHTGLGGSSYTYVSTNADGTMILKLGSQEIYDSMAIGDILTCRMAGDNQNTFSLTNSKNILVKDTVFYGYSAALMVVVSGNSSDNELVRVHNSARSPYVIDKETYETYSAWEEKYGVDLEIHIDEKGRYRGSTPRVGSVDATHMSGSSEGLDITSCLFENMCDDGSNQHGTSYRLLDAKDNGDGTTTLYYKGMVTSTYFGLHSASSNKVRTLTPIGFNKGDRIYVYTSKGELVCDTDVLENSKNEDDLVEIFDLSPMRYIINVKSVKVPTDSVNFDALDGYDLADNHYNMTNKVIVDNINYCSSGFTIDNLLVQNSSARGVLIKTINSTVKSSTFRDVTSTGNLLCVETSWGESTVSRNIVISKCLFDNTGFNNEDPIRAPIAISGLSTYGNANTDTLRTQNILITECEFKDYGHDFGIYVNGAQNVRIIDNIFDPEDAADPGRFVKIVTAIDVEISGNQYRNSNGEVSPIRNIDADDFAFIHGDDVGDDFKSQCDIYIGDTHLCMVRIRPDNESYFDIAKIAARTLGDYCGYAVSATNFYNKNLIRLVVEDVESENIDSNSYTVTCDGEDLVITASSKPSLHYAFEDFVNYIKELNASNQTIRFDSGFYLERSFELKNIYSTDTSIIKYTGFWNSLDSTMESASDADYFEIDVKGNSVTFLFDKSSQVNVYIDGKYDRSYSVKDELTLYLDGNKHTVKIESTDMDNTISFAGIKCLNSSVARTADKDHYVQFIGDSMLDDPDSFAHKLGNVLDWDYSVYIGDTLPEVSNTGRTPDIFVIFLGTDAITSSSTNTEITAFKSNYKALIESIISKYPSYKKIYLMQALSTSDAGDMFNTSHNRYKAIAAIKSFSLDNISIPLNNKINLISADTVIGWNIEFDAEKDPTHPTDAGEMTLLSKLSSYIASDTYPSDYVNVTFPLSSMKNYNGTWTKNVTENNVTFNRYNFDKNGHVFISGSDAADISANSGRYLIIKYRTSGDYSLSINVRTNDYGTDLLESGKGFVSTVTKPTIYTPTDWEIAVVDLAQFNHYTTNINTKVQIRITTTLSTIDIAHVSIVDDIMEARLLIMSTLDSFSYRMYEDWTLKGVKTAIDGSILPEDVEEEKVDLSFVNQDFRLESMQKYNGANGKITSPDMLLYTGDDGVVFNRFEFTQTGHIFIKGGNYLTTISGDTGNYFIIKYRAKNNSHLSLEMQTSHLTFTSSAPYKTLSTSSRPASFINDDWEVALIDLSAFPNYQRDADLDVLIRITTSCEYVDIAYAAIVDNVDEANRYIKIQGDESYVYYNDWSSDGTISTIK